MHSPPLRTAATEDAVQQPTHLLRGQLRHVQLGCIFPNLVQGPQQLTRLLLQQRYLPVLHRNGLIGTRVPRGTRVLHGGAHGSPNCSMQFEVWRRAAHTHHHHNSALGFPHFGPRAPFTGNHKIHCDATQHACTMLAEQAGEGRVRSTHQPCCGGRLPLRDLSADS